MNRIVIVGGVAGGMSTATRLRRLDEQAHITVVERGEHVSFANCGLPYYLGGVIEDRDALLLQTPESLQARFNLDVRVRTEAISIDRGGHTLTVRNLETGHEEALAYDHLVLATGARPARPELPGIERAAVLRSIDDMDLIAARIEEVLASAGFGGASAAEATRPSAGASGGKSLTGADAMSDDGPAAVVLGGGFIGLEVAENLRRRGLAVTLVEAAPQILTPLDPELAWPVRERLEAHGVRVLTGSAAARIEPDHVELEDGSRLPAELVIAAMGVVPESDLAKGAGLELGPRGAVLVDDQQRTNDPAIFAIGDMATKCDAIDGSHVLVPLAQAANRHGRLVADVICGRDVHALPALGTAIVGVFGLQAAVTGWNETRAIAAGRDVRVIHTHPLDHAGYYPGARGMKLKLVVDARTDQILGAQGVGEAGVDKRIDVIATAMRGGLKASDLADLELAYAPQFGSAKDPVALLGMIAGNRAAGDDAVQWHEVADVAADGATLVDVRTPGEFAAGAIPGSINIPVDDLRSRLGEIPPGRVILICRVGQRGHVATRILEQAGHDVANLDGGYLTWVDGAAASAD